MLQMTFATDRSLTLARCYRANRAGTMCNASLLLHTPALNEPMDEDQGDIPRSQPTLATDTGADNHTDKRPRIEE